MSVQDPTEAMAQRILESVLRQLEGSAGRPAPAPASAPSVDQVNKGSGPVIIILPGGSRTAQNEAAATANGAAALPLAAKQSGCGCQNNSHTVGENSVQSSHPGLERFDLPEDNGALTASRRCFIEPDRACVGSGACRMRGY